MSSCSEHLIVIKKRIDFTGHVQKGTPLVFVLFESGLIPFLSLLGHPQWSASLMILLLKQQRSKSLSRRKQQRIKALDFDAACTFTCGETAGVHLLVM